MSKKGLVLVLSGFSGVGKGTVVKELLSRHSNYALSISVTTRSPREGEEHGREYFFITEEEFAALEKEGKLMEWAGYVGHHYGTPRDYVMSHIEAGRDVILEIEIQGAMQVKERYPEAVLVFVVPPSAAVLKERLSGRGSETEAVIEERMKRAVEEAKGMEEYEYLLVNDDLDTCVSQLHEIMCSEHRKAARNQELIRSIRKDLTQFVEGD